MIRATAYWAIGQIDGYNAQSFIDAHFAEEVEEVQEMIKGLEMRRN